MKCQHCKGTENLCINSKRKSKKTGKISYGYVCRKCNTERLKKCRKDKKKKAVIYKSIYKSIKKYPKKQEARLKLNVAVKNGEVEKPKRCSKCGEKKPLDGHHEDYKKPLEVIWLCRGCHADLHGELRK